jgi:hypothetical protein
MDQRTLHRSGTRGLTASQLLTCGNSNLVVADLWQLFVPQKLPQVSNKAPKGEFSGSTGLEGSNPFRVSDRCPVVAPRIPSLPGCGKFFPAESCHNRATTRAGVPQPGNEGGCNHSHADVIARAITTRRVPCERGSPGTFLGREDRPNKTRVLPRPTRATDRSGALRRRHRTASLRTSHRVDSSPTWSC